MSAGADAFRIATEFVTMGARARLAVEVVTRHYTMLVLTQVKANASGRPGPRAPTGQYRSSINAEFFHDGGDLVGSVGTNAAQARRLEFGFVGADRLGRVYAQPPYKHFGPAIDKYTDPYVNAVGKAVLVI